MRHYQKSLGICHLQERNAENLREALSDTLHHTGSPLKAFSHRYHKIPPQQKLEQMSWCQKDPAQIQLLELLLATTMCQSSPQSNKLFRRSSFYSLTRYG